MASTSGLIFWLFLLAVYCKAVHSQLPEDAPVRHIVCGSRFIDPASSALLCDVVLQGEVTRVRQASPVTPLLYRASVTVQKVYKGQSMLQLGSSFTEEGDAVEAVQVEVDKFGPEENEESCVGKVTPGDTYLFFLSPVRNGSVGRSAASSGPPVLANTAMPRPLDMVVVKQVMMALCEGCPEAPAIKRVRCQRCAAQPVMQKEMVEAGNHMIQAGTRLALRCVARGSPMPMYTWLKDGKMLHASDYPSADSGDQPEATERPAPAAVVKMGPITIRHEKRYSLLVVKEVSPEDGGTYRCIATNAVGEAEQVVQVVVKGESLRRPPPTSAQPFPTSSTSVPEPEPRKVMPVHDACAQQPCYHGGTCTEDDTASGGFVCACPLRFHGNKCQFLKHEAAVEERETLLQPDLRTPAEKAKDKDDDDDDDDSSSSNSTRNASPDPPDNIHTAAENAAQAGSPISSGRNFSPDHEPLPDPEVTGDNDSSLAARLAAKKQRKMDKAGLGRTESADGKEGKSAIPQLKLSECPDQSYCQNGGVCKVVVKIQRQFCECPRGFVGRHCEVAV